MDTYRHSNINTKFGNADYLSLSQASVAVLLAFTAVHAKADNAPDQNIAVRLEALALTQAMPVYSPLDANAPVTPPGTSTTATIARNVASLAETVPMDKHVFVGEDPAPASLAVVSPVSVAVAVPRPASVPASAPDGTRISPVVAAPVEPKSVPSTRNSSLAARLSSSISTRYDKGNLVVPGRYRAALYANQTWIGSADITLRELDGPGKAAQPVFDRDLLMRIGVDVTRLGDTAHATLDAADKSGGVPLGVLIPQATATFDAGEQRLDLSIPQAMMSRNARGWIDPKFWDDGVPAAVVQYNANVYHSSGRGFSTTQNYLGLNTGVNIGPWRFRYNGNVTSTSGAGTHVQSMQTYLQRSIEPIKSQLTVGDSYTDGSIFDSFGITGAQIGTDDRMYPESQRGYAPTVRGIANSNAKVQVKQSGDIIYETTVAPGPFEIDDLYATGYGGDLQVVMTEADGSQHTSLLPYSAPVNALREGRWRYNVAAGLYRNTSLSTTCFRPVSSTA